MNFKSMHLPPLDRDLVLFFLLLFQVLLIAKNDDVPGAALYYQNKFWKDWEPGHDLRINSFSGHMWNARVGNKIIKTWTLSDAENQIITLRSDKLQAALPRASRTFTEEVDEEDPVAVNRRWQAQRIEESRRAAAKAAAAEHDPLELNRRWMEERMRQ
eukprot:TRINITY_DN170_c0_g1_i3.p1 TRINITY_DN170_c0_g1~~TRINITY_DN170_c0_g1_i3.p1  ORF type:complete len:158 (-),score=33.08 TRINITY_DN170_c0_g1_i3:216-689(-)